jgi:hypothetical protein
VRRNAIRAQPHQDLHRLGGFSDVVLGCGSAVAGAGWVVLPQVDRFLCAREQGGARRTCRIPRRTLLSMMTDRSLD